MRSRLPALGCALLFAMPSLAQVTRGEMLAIQCFGCHGYEGRGSESVPGVGGGAEEIREELTEFKSGDLSSTIMGRIARGYTHEEIRLIADYFGTQR